MSTSAAPDTAPSPARAPRADNRREPALDAAAALFCAKGYHATSMRDIAAAVGMLPGSLYYHFPSKDALLVAVYEEGARRIAERVDAAAAARREPWARLEAACEAHLETLLERSDYAQVVIRVLPDDAPAVRDDLIALRDAFESRYRPWVEALPLAAGVDAGTLRRMLLGAMNYAPTWYRPGGDSPAEIARGFVRLLRLRCDNQGDAR